MSVPANHDDTGRPAAAKPLSLAEDAGHAAALVKQGAWTDAIAAWGKCFEVHAGHRQAWWYSSLGVALRNAKRRDEAEQLYRRALIECPQDAAGWIGLAELHAADQNWREASQFWHECLQRHDANAHPWWYAACAQALGKTGRPEEARTLYLRAQARWPDDATGWVGLAELASNEQHWQQAVAAWTLCISRYEATARCWWYGSLCVALRKTSQWPEAERYFDKAVERWPVEGLHLYLDALFHDRHLKRLSRLLQAEGLHPTALIQHHRRRLALYEGLPPSELPPLADLQIESYPPYLLLQMQKIAAEAAIRLKDCAYLDQLTAWHGFSVPVHTAIAIIRFYLAEAEIVKAKALLERQLQGVQPHRAIHFLEVTREMASRDKSLPATIVFPDDWRQSARLYIDSVPDATNQEFLRRCLVAPLLRVPAGEQDFMDIRYDATRRDALMAQVFKAIEREHPLGLIRLGDGEAYGFDHPLETPEIASRFAEDDDFREAHWWAKHPSAQQRQMIRRDFERAVLAADILGIPSIYKLARAFDTAADNLFLGMPFRSFYKIMQSLERLRVLKDGTTLFTEERCHYLLLTPDRIDDLIARAPRVTVVSCWTAEQLQLKRRTGVTFIVIPPHTKVAGHTRHDASEALFECYPRILEQIEEATRSFSLVIVAAGLIGKIFVARARQRGSVALDAGAMLDYYIGLQTRNASETI